MSLGMLLIRADANSKIGHGHVMRCLALAQAWIRRGGRVWFYGDIDETVVNRLMRSGVAVYLPKICSFLETVKGLNLDWIVLDGYGFGADVQEELKNRGRRVLFVDDYGHAESYCADLVLNQNIYAKDVVYLTTWTGTRFLLGTDYAMLREEFLRIGRNAFDTPTKARRVLVTMGGADPDGVTLKVIDALRGTGLHARIVVGGSNPCRDDIIALARAEPEMINVICNVEDMPREIARADLAVSAGGSTCWELAYLGTPFLVTAIAENQIPNATRLQEEGVAHPLGNAKTASVDWMRKQIVSLAEDQDARAEMREKGQRLVDGTGADRVVEAMIGASA